MPPNGTNLGNKPSLVRSDKKLVSCKETGLDYTHSLGILTYQSGSRRLNSDPKMILDACYSHASSVSICPTRFSLKLMYRQIKKVSCMVQLAWFYQLVKPSSLFKLLVPRPDIASHPVKEFAAV